MRVLHAVDNDGGDGGDDDADNDDHGGNDDAHDDDEDDEDADDDENNDDDENKDYDDDDDDAFLGTVGWNRHCKCTLVNIQNLQRKAASCQRHCYIVIDTVIWAQGTP